eukprot:368961_1
MFDDAQISIVGFSDLFLFCRLNLLECAPLIEIYGRKGINVDMNGVYKKQNELHCGRPWYLKLKLKDDGDNGKHQWVIRYLSTSQVWLLDRRGLRNDDVANGIGHGDVMTPLQIHEWE